MFLCHDINDKKRLSLCKLNDFIISEKGNINHHLNICFQRGFVEPCKLKSSFALGKHNMMSGFLGCVHMSTDLPPFKSVVILHHIQLKIKYYTTVTKGISH